MVINETHFALLYDLHWLCLHPPSLRGADKNMVCVMVPGNAGPLFTLVLLERRAGQHYQELAPGT